jgi:hypothetical protein
MIFRVDVHEPIDLQYTLDCMVRLAETFGGSAIKKSAKLFVFVF